MPDPTFNGDIQASTFNDYIADVAYDNWFVETAYQQHMRAIGAVDPFTGGKLMEEPFIMGSPAAGAAAPGTNFEIEHVQQLAAMAFPPRLYTSRDMFETFSLQVQNKGPNARIKLKDLYYRNAVAAISTNVEVDCYWHGQAAISGQVASNRTNNTDGMAEALNDGKNNSWQGDVFVNYGAQVRNGAIQNANNSIPVFLGNPDGTAGSISVRALINFLVRQRKFCGGRSPEITITTPNGWSYILSALQTQQQFTTGWEKYSFKSLPTVPDTEGIAFLGTVIYDDILTPGAAWGADFPTSYITTSNLTSTFTSASTATGTTSPSQLPASTTITVGETLWALTGRAWKFRPTDDPDFLFGARENQVYNNNTNDAFLLNLGINVYSPSPRMSGQAYGFNG
jgi:hypothetical protein